MTDETIVLRAFIGGLGPVELIIILLIVLLIFGPMKLPQIGDALGKSVRHFKRGISGKAGEQEESDSGGPVDVTPEPIERDEGGQSTSGTSAAAGEASEPAKNERTSG